MNKLSALYKVGKKVREGKACEGTLTVEALLDTTVLGTMRSEIKAGSEKREKKTEIQFGEENFKFEHSGKGHGEGCCGGHPHGMKAHGFRRMHHHHGHCCSGGMGKLDHALFMLKVLDKTEYQEKEDGSGLFSLQLTLADLPEGIQGMIKSKCCGVEGHPSFEECCPDHAKAWLASCGCMDLDLQTITPVSLNISLAVNADHSPSELKAVLLASAKDNAGKEHSVTINANGLCK